MSRDLIKRILYVLVGTAGAKAVTVLITPVIARVLGSSGYGDYTFVLSVFWMSAVFVDAGTFDGIRKHVAESIDDDSWTANVFGFHARLGALVAVLGAVIIVVLALSGAVASRFGRAFRGYFLLVAAMLLTQQTLRVTRGALMGLGRDHLSEAVRLLREVTFAVVGLALAALGFNVGGLLVGHLTGTVVATVVAVVFLSRNIDVTAVLRPTPAEFPTGSLAMYNFGAVMLLALTTSLYHVDVVLLRSLVGSKATGHYRAALVAAEALWFVPVVLQTVLLQSSSELWSEEQRQEISTLASRMTRLVFALTTLLGVGLVALREPFIVLYFGTGFRPATLALILLIPGALCFAIARPIIAIGQGLGRLAPLLAATGIAALFNFALNLLLIPRFGMEGAAVATSLSYGAMLVLHTVAGYRLGFDPLGDLRPLRILATGLITAPVVVGLTNIIRNDIVALSVVPPIGLLVYAVAALRLGVVDREEIDECVDVLPEPVRDTVHQVISAFR